MQSDIVTQGLELMLYGMGTVVVFLALLVLAMTAMSRVMERYFPDASPAKAAAVRPRQFVAESTQGDRGASLDQAIDPEIVAVITAAIHQHRQGKFQ
ncbi:MAG: OadG family protein [Pseudomonadota bacterium]